MLYLIMLFSHTPSHLAFSHPSAHAGRSPLQIHVRQVATLATGSPAHAGRVAAAVKVSSPFERLRCCNLIYLILQTIWFFKLDVWVGFFLKKHQKTLQVLMHFKLLKNLNNELAEADLYYLHISSRLPWSGLQGKTAEQVFCKVM